MGLDQAVLQGIENGGVGDGGNVSNSCIWLTT